MTLEAAAPEACDLLVEAGHVVPVEPHGVVLEDHAVAVQDGIIVAVRLKKTTHEEARNITTILKRSGGRTLGVAANGARERRRDYYRGRHQAYYTDSAS